MKRHLVAASCAAAALLLFAAPAFAGQTIGTFGSWNGSEAISTFGYPNTATYGQVITAPAGATLLTSFTFELAIPNTATFRAEVYAWDGSEATGPNLYESGSMTTTSSSMQSVTIGTAVPVTAGSQYVMFLSTSKDSGSGSGVWGFVSANPYGGGDFVYQNNGTDPSTWTSTPWTVYGGDLAFSAIFNGQPVGPHETCYNDLGTDGCSQLARVAVCDPLVGFKDIEVRERMLPEYVADTPAAYVQGYGLVCALSNLASYGGDPSLYSDAGYKVDNTGTRTPNGTDENAFGAFYEYFAKA
jgi:hypothetical protein